MGGEVSVVRAIEMSLGSASPRIKGGRVILPENTDPGIPIDHVPYFAGDLRNLAVVAVLMIILLFVGSQAIPLIIK